MPNVNYFTWSPNPAIYGRWPDPRLQFHTQVQDLKPCFTCWMPGWEMSPELFQNGNVHWHGHYEVNPSYSYRWYRKVLPKLKERGFVKIDTIKYKLDTTYMNKDHELMVKIMEYDLPLNKDHELVKPRRKKRTPEELKDDLESTMMIDWGLYEDSDESDYSVKDYLHIRPSAEDTE